jgi:CheY-like chemotaxis protein
MEDNEAVRAGGLSSEGQPVSKLRILMVDDEPSIRGLFETVAKRLMSDMVGVFDTVGSGSEALERIIDREDEYDAMITDLRMPGMSGLELAKAVGEKAPHIKIYAISGTMGEDLPEPEKHGFKGALCKPAGLEQIKAFFGQIHAGVFAQNK